MDRYRIPNATLYGSFDSAQEAIRALDAVDWPVVVKADGLCAGKGVLVAETREEAEAFIRRVLQKHELGPGGIAHSAGKGAQGRRTFVHRADRRAIVSAHGHRRGPQARRSTAIAAPIPAGWARTPWTE